MKMRLSISNFKKESRTIIGQVWRFVLWLFASILILVVGVAWVLPSPYNNSYQSVIIRQYDRWKSIEESKIALIGTSALAYGCDMDLLEKITGKKCQILGNHAGMASPYFIEMTKCNLREGDIVVIQYANYHKDSLGTELLLTGIGNRIDMYRYFRWYNYKDVFFDYHNYLINKLTYVMYGGMESSGEYSSRSFDKNGNMIFPRMGCELSSPIDKTTELDFDFNMDYIQYLNEYTDYCSKIGVKVMITVQPYLDEYLTSDEKMCEKWTQELDGLLDAPVISNQWDYVYSREYMYGYDHCNTCGAKKRTQQLGQDILYQIEKDR